MNTLVCIFLWQMVCVIRELHIFALLWIHYKYTFAWPHQTCRWHNDSSFRSLFFTTGAVLMLGFFIACFHHYCRYNTQMPCVVCTILRQVTMGFVCFPPNYASTKCPFTSMEGTSSFHNCASDSLNLHLLSIIESIWSKANVLNCMNAYTLISCLMHSLFSSNIVMYGPLLNMLCEFYSQHWLSSAMSAIWPEHLAVTREIQTSSFH